MVIQCFILVDISVFCLMSYGLFWQFSFVREFITRSIGNMFPELFGVKIGARGLSRCILLASVDEIMSLDNKEKELW